MTASASTPLQRDTDSPRRPIALAATLLSVAVALAYSDTWRAPMEFDDKASLLDNPTITHLWPPWRALSPPPGSGLTVEGRPLLNLSFAVNHALSGFDLWSYHFANIAIHALAGLVLFGLVRRTLLLPVMRGRFENDALSLAAIGAGGWVLHPLQTESVTYLVQRAESFAGLCVLFTVYAFVRAVGAARPGTDKGRRGFHPGWAAAAVTSAAAGMAIKETAVVAPVLVLLYDRTFCGGSFRAAWRRRKSLHVALAATWLVAGVLAVRAGTRGGTFALHDPTAWWRYAIAQCDAVVRYLSLAVWPHPLVFDHGVVFPTLAHVVSQALLLLVLVVGTGCALRLRPWLGFIGAWFFVTLAPSSVLPGTVQTVVEHRMYLPLAAIVAAAVAGIAALRPAARLPAGIAVALAFGTLTYRRNGDYRSELALWNDTVAKAPRNARALANLGSCLCAAGRFDEAAVRLEAALRLDPANGDAHFNLGVVRLAQRRSNLALAEFDAAIRANPQNRAAYLNDAAALESFNRREAATAVLERAVTRWPNDAEAHSRLGLLLSDTDRQPEAEHHCRVALELRPGDARAECGLGQIALRAGQTPRALGHLHRAVASDPNLLVAHFQLANALLAAGDADAAIREFRAAIALDPSHPEAHLNLGIAEARRGQYPVALAELTVAVRLLPQSAEAQHNLAIALSESGQPDVAIAHFDAALRLRPVYPEAHYNYGNALLKLGRIADARAQFNRALAQNPGLAAAREMLERIDAAR